MYTKEQKILRFSMLLLFLALMIVYIVWYQIKGDMLKKQWKTEETSGSGIQILSITGTGNIQTEIHEDEGISEKPKAVITGTISSGSSLSTGNMKKADGIKVLSGTSIFYGKIEIIEKLGIKYQYALTDSTGIRYIYLGTPSYDFASIARALKGNIYTMATEQEIIENKLFGNKVVYINLPEYKDKQVIMLVYLNDGIWLIQVEYSKYHKSKSYIKSLFIN